jgi:hypothetical protein
VWGNGGGSVGNEMGAVGYVTLAEDTLAVGDRDRSHAAFDLQQHRIVDAGQDGRSAQQRL